MNFRTFVLAAPLAGLIGTIGFATSALADNDTPMKVEDDSPAYKALKNGNYDEARERFEAYYKNNPSDPLIDLDLGLAYQMTGRMDLAEPLYRQAMANGGDLVPDVTTTQDSKGLTVAAIACDNLKYGRQDAGACEPKVAPPAPPPVMNFIVFFDFNKSNLTADARQVVAEAVDAAKHGAVTKVTVVGHTDTVGSHSYNQRLSERRAASVKAEMVSQGLPAAEIFTMGKSFDDPLVPTGPNVREPQNRRAVITLGEGSGV